MPEGQSIVSQQPRTLIHHELALRPEPGRVLLREFKPTVEPRDRNPIDKPRVNHIVDRIMALSPDESAAELDCVLREFSGRHHNLPEILDTRAADMESALEPHPVHTQTQRRLIGSYFLNEYSFESTALFNPSMVVHPDQTGVPAGAVRFIISLRGVGEGHISSLTFKTGTIAADGAIAIDDCSGLAEAPRIRGRTPVMNGEEVEVVFRPDSALDERVIFPVTLAQRNGIEDARFLEFNHDGKRRYLATYTAYSGLGIHSEMLETEDFQTFRLTPLNGAASRNKGMALFPRKLDDRYAMVGRHDNENLHLIWSNDLYTWDDGDLLLRPEFPWEFIQLGNCGAPVDLDDCWLLLIHGVGAMRRYGIGAVLLDKDDPLKVIGRSRRPLIQPAGSEREGYVPNVAYTCGALRFGEQIIIPYGVADTFTRFATVDRMDLIRSLM